MARRGGPLTTPWPPLLLLLSLLGALLGEAGAARLPSGRLGPGPSVEEENPLPSKVANQQQRRCAALPARVLRQVLGPAFNPAYMAFSLEEPPGRGGGSSFGLGLFHDDGDGDFQQHSARVLKQSPWTPADPARPSPSKEPLSPFEVEEDYRQVLGDEPAWQVRYEMPMAMLSGDDVDVASGAPRSHRKSAGRRHVDSDPDLGDHLDDGDGDDGEGLKELKARRTERAAGLQRYADREWHCEAPLRWLDLGPNYFPRFLRSADCGHHSCAGGRFVCKPRSFSVKVLRRRDGQCAPPGGLALDESSVGLPSELRDLWVWEMRAVNFCCVCRERW